MAAEDEDSTKLQEQIWAELQEKNRKCGQKYPTPSPGFGDRVFYESLYRENPDSIMAQEWCVAYGVLGKEEAERMYEIIRVRKGGRASPTKSAPKSRSSSGKSSSKRSRVVNDAVVDTGMGVSSGYEGVGTTGI